MIRKIKFNNFYSFKEDQEISFLTHKKKTFDYFSSKNKDSEQITKIAGFVGGNASGKTNIMRLLSFVGDFIVSSARQPLLYVPFKSFFDNKEESKFYIEFESKGNIFYYSFVIKDNVVLEEYLKIKDVSNDKDRKRTVFSRKNSITNTKSKIDFEINFKDTFFPTNMAEMMQIVRPDISLVSFIKSQFDIKIINDFSDYFLKLKTNINERGDINNPIHQLQSLMYYVEDEVSKGEMNKFVRDFDLGIEEIQILKKVLRKDTLGKEDINLKISATHNTKESNKTFDWNYESEGTKSIIFVFANILWALKNNSVVVIDEMERGLHPEAFNKIINYFINKNEHGSAQLLFSSHSLGFMSKLDSQQIFMVDKNDKSESVVYRLSDLKMRPEENLYSKYMSGAYGAFPDIKI